MKNKGQVKKDKRVYRLWGKQYARLKGVFDTHKIYNALDIVHCV